MIWVPIDRVLAAAEERSLAELHRLRVSSTPRPHTDRDPSGELSAKRSMAGKAGVEAKLAKQAAGRAGGLAYRPPETVCGECRKKHRKCTHQGEECATCSDI